MHIYDYIVIGSGLTGLAIAKKIHRETDNILILEAQELTGGDNRPANLPTNLGNQTINNGLRFFPDTAASQKAALFLEELLGKQAFNSSSENLIETYESKPTKSFEGDRGFKKFIGFGEKSPDCYEELAYFLSQNKRSFVQDPYLWVQDLTEGLQNKILKNSIVTRFGFEGLQADSSELKLTHVVINGSKQLFAHNFIFAGPIKDLAALVPDDVLSARLKVKLKKAKAWQGVCLDLLHNTVVNKSNMFLLDGTTEDSLSPCIGCFQSPAAPSVVPSAAPPAVAPTTQQTSQQISQWLSFIDSEVAEDTENISLILKKMKRQIKRAFPEMADSITKERIFITPVLSGSDLKLSANGTLPKVPNLWVASSQASSYKNLLGSLMQAQFILSSLGFLSGLEDNSAAVSIKFSTGPDLEA